MLGELWRKIGENPQASAAILTGLLALIGVIVGLVTNGVLQFVTDRRKFRYERQKQTDEIAYAALAARVKLRAELSSVVRTMAGQMRFVEDERNHFIWIPFYEPTLPTDTPPEARSVLTPKEIEAVRAFRFVHQEHMGYIAANAQKTRVMKRSCR